MSAGRRLVRWLRTLLVGVPRLRHIDVVAEFAAPDGLLEAVRHLRREEGLDELDAYVPYPVEGLEEALGLERARIPRIVALAGFGSGALTWLLLWWINVVDFPRNVGGRPLHPAPAFVPVVFELTILGGATAGFLTFFLSGGMPRLWHPVFDVEGFESASVDGYWLAIGRLDAETTPAFGEDVEDRRARLGALLKELGARRIVDMEADA